MSLQSPPESPRQVRPRGQSVRFDTKPEDSDSDSDSVVGPYIPPEIKRAGFARCRSVPNITLDKLDANDIFDCDDVEDLELEEEKENNSISSNHKPIARASSYGSMHLALDKKDNMLIGEGSSMTASTETIAEQDWESQQADNHNPTVAELQSIENIVGLCFEAVYKDEPRFPARDLIVSELGIVIDSERAATEDIPTMRRERDAEFDPQSLPSDVFGEHFMTSVDGTSATVTSHMTVVSMSRDSDRITTTAQPVRMTHSTLASRGSLADLDVHATMIGSQGLEDEEFDEVNQEEQARADRAVREVFPDTHYDFINKNGLTAIRLLRRDDALNNKLFGTREEREAWDNYQMAHNHIKTITFDLYRRSTDGKRCQLRAPERNLSKFRWVLGQNTLLGVTNAEVSHAQSQMSTYHDRISMFEERLNKLKAQNRAAREILAHRPKPQIAPRRGKLRRAKSMHYSDTMPLGESQ